jgi:peptide chain release factor
MTEEASANGCPLHLLEVIPGRRPDLFKSALIAIEGEDISTFLAQWTGTIQWIGKSQFRPNHRRKNWFVGVTPYPAPEEIESNRHEFRFETMRSSGPGGQHVNKTASAVRVTHVPTGICALAQEERSQHRNRKLALSRLLEKLNQRNRTARSRLRQIIWDGHNELERGNPVRIYEGTDFKLRRIAEKGASDRKLKGRAGKKRSS